MTAAEGLPVRARTIGLALAPEGRESPELKMFSSLRYASVARAKVVSFGLALLASGCGAVFPEMSTPLRQPPPGFTMDPPPPSDVLYLAFAKATIPQKTRDGRAWDSVGGSLPDPFAKFIVDDVDLIVTPIQENTLTPTWPNQKRGNYRIRDGARVRVELWDNNPLNNHPICTKEVHELNEQLSNATSLDITCDSGAYIQVTAEPAHGKIGLGLFYEIHTDAAFVVRVLAESPAARAGLQRGDQILSIMGKPVKGMSEGEVRSLVNANAATGLDLHVRGANHQEHDAALKDGPVYALLAEDVP